MVSKHNSVPHDFKNTLSRYLYPFYYFRLSFGTICSLFQHLSDFFFLHTHVYTYICHCIIYFHESFSFIVRFTVSFTIYRIVLYAGMFHDVQVTISSHC